MSEQAETERASSWFSIVIPPRCQLGGPESLNHYSFMLLGWQTILRISQGVRQ